MFGLPYFQVNNPARTATLLLVAALSGCADGTSALVESVRYAVGSNASAANATLNPEFKYLRVTIAGRVALLVLGYVERNPQGPIEVWYSAEREVLRLQNGRIVGAAGLTTEWRNVTLSTAPAWSSVATETTTSIIRGRDVMPGYRYGKKDKLTLRRTVAPLRSALLGLDPLSLGWFEESVVADGDVTPRDALPVARYAVDFSGGTETVVYAEQCLSIDVCFTLQRWPAIASTAKITR